MILFPSATTMLPLSFEKSFVKSDTKMHGQRNRNASHITNLEMTFSFKHYCLFKGGESSSQFRWFTIAKIEL